MTYYLTYQIKGIEGEQFVMPIQQTDDVKFICSRIKKEFGIIPNLTARIYGSNLQSTSIMSQCVRGQDVVTFDVKEADGKKQKFEMYRKPIITPRYQSKTTFIVFSTVNFKSMTIGNKIQVDIDKDTNDSLQKKIKDMIGKSYKNDFNAQKLKSTRILLFLPGGIPFLKGTIGEFIESFPDYMPHLYAIIFFDKSITDTILDRKYESVCNIKNNELKSLISPDTDTETCGLCEIAAVLGYIQKNGPNVKRMIYSIAKYCPFAPMICGLYNLACLVQPTGRTILQITAPLLKLFEEMSNNMPDRSNLFSSTVRFLSFFMNVKISDRVPCTEFIRPFYNIGFEKYFYTHFPEGKNSQIESIVAFDPDFRDQDWIRFQLPSLQEEDFEYAMEHAKALKIIPPLSLREMHRVSLFQGTNGPWLFLTASVSKEEKDRDKIEYINPEVGIIETGKYEDVAAKTIGVDYTKKKEEFDKKLLDLVDKQEVTQLVYICVDKSGSMRSPYDQGINRFEASQKFFIKFTQACYKFHTPSFYGSIMFNERSDERNSLNPLSENFSSRMVVPGERPTGGTAMFAAIKRAADIMLEKNRGNKYPNAVLRVVVISDGVDIYAGPNDIANVANHLLRNKVRVDAIIVSNEIAKELVALSHYTGGVAMFPRGLNDGLDLFNQEQFFNVDLRFYNDFHAPNITANDISRLPNYGINDLDREVPSKPSLYADPNKIVTSPKYAISEYNKEMMAQLNGTGTETESKTAHPSQKRIINELKKIITEPDEDVRVFPLKDRIDAWRVLIKGFEGSLYADKWFYMIIEFPLNYPQHYPLFRYVSPPFHPNVSDSGRICISTLDQTYRSDKSIKELIGEVRYLLFEPNFDDCVDVKRSLLSKNKPEYERIVREWNQKNGKSNPEDFEKNWKIQPDGKLMLDNASAATVPEYYLDPISRSIMKEPVKATSGVFYEKRELEKYLKQTPNATCKGKTGDDRKPIPLPLNENMNLPVDNEMKSRIAKWKKDNNYFENEDEADENENIAEFRKKKITIDHPDILKNYNEANIKKPDAQRAKPIYDYGVDTAFSNRQTSRPRPELK